MKYVRIFDSVGEAGSVINPDHARIDGADREALLGYLRSGTLIMTARGLQQDILQPQEAPKVPITFHADGEYIWTGAVVYYLDKYGIAPDPDFLTYFKLSNRATAPTLSEAQIESALKDLMKQH